MTPSQPAARPILHIHRIGKRPDLPPTVGKMRLYASNGAPVFTCVCIEEPWKGNARRVSCIPPGIYGLAPWDSAKFPGTLQVIGEEPARGAVLIHAGNNLSDTEGCILPGMDYQRNASGAVVGVVESRPAVAVIRRGIGVGGWLVITADAAHA